MVCWDLGFFLTHMLRSTTMRSWSEIGSVEVTLTILDGSEEKKRSRVFSFLVAKVTCCSRLFLCAISIISSSSFFVEELVFGLSVSQSICRLKSPVTRMCLWFFFPGSFSSDSCRHSRVLALRASLCDL